MDHQTIRRRRNRRQSTIPSSISRSPQKEEYTNTNQATQDLREEGEKILLN